MLFREGIFGCIVLTLFIACLSLKLIRQIKEVIYVRRIIKPDDYEKKIILKSNYIHITLYGLFILTFIISILVGFNIINFSFLTLELATNVCTVSIVAMLIGEFIVIPKLNSNIRF